MITATGDLKRPDMGLAVRTVIGIPTIDVADLVAAMLDQVVNKVEKELLMPEDLIRIAETISQAT